MNYKHIARLSLNICLLSFVVPKTMFARGESPNMHNKFVFASTKLPTQFDPASYTALDDWYLYRNLTSNLVALDDANQIVSDLAADWKFEDNGTKVIFNLKNNRFWSDGSKITAKEIRDNIIIHNGHSRKDFFKTILKYRDLNKSVFIDKQGALVILLKHRYDPLLRQLTRAEFGLLDWNNNKKNPKNVFDFKKFSGPYKIGGVLGNDFFLKAQVEEEGKVSTIFFRYVKSADDLGKLVAAGDIDFAELPPGANFVADKGLFNKLYGGLDNLFTIQIREVSQELKARLKQFSLLIDKTKFVTGSKKVAYSLSSFSKPASDKSRGQMKRVSVTASLHLKLTLGNDLSSAAVHDANELKRQLKELSNIDLEIETDPNFREKWKSETYASTLARMGVSTFDDRELLNGYFCSGLSIYTKLDSKLRRLILDLNRTKFGSSDYYSMLDQINYQLSHGGDIIPLYHYPREFFLHSRWDKKSYNPLNPYPYVAQLKLGIK